MMELTQEQGEAVRKVKDWWTKGGQVFELSGAAGTGKTSLAKYIVAELGLSDSQKVFCAFTGKASLVLSQKGCRPSSTVHSLIYKSHLDEFTGKWNFKFDKNELRQRGIKLVILDEAPMLGKDVAQDLLACGVKVLALGDKWQLPPVGSDALFGVSEPDFLLTEIHRQAADNPIINLATYVRNGGKLKLGAYGDSKILDGKRFSREQMAGADIVLCGKNDTRHHMNKQYRIHTGMDELGVEPQPGERLICLRNNKLRGFLNGQMFTVVSQVSDGADVKCEVKPLDCLETLPVEISTPIQYFQGKDADLDWKVKRSCDEFAYGWVTTCHKFQGSQAEHVMIIDQSKVFKEHASRWLYTAITRASEKVTIYL